MENSYYDRNKLTDDEKERIKQLLGNKHIKEQNGFERHFVRYFREHGKKPATPLGIAWVEYGLSLGYNEDGFGPDGKHFHNRYEFYKGLNKYGFDRHGIHHITKSKEDPEGYDINGRDKDGYSRLGFDLHGYDRNGINRNGVHKSNDPAYIQGQLSQKHAPCHVPKVKALNLGLYSVYSSTDGQD